MAPALEHRATPRLFGLLLAACLLPARAAAPDLPAELTTAGPQLSARLDSELGLIAKDDLQPVLASVSHGMSFASADYASGQFKGVAVAAPSGVNYTLATAAIDFMATNTGAVPIALLPGMIALDMEASFSRSLGGSPGTVANTINAVFSLAILAPDHSTRYSGHGFYQYRYAQDVGDPGPDLVPLKLEEGGFSVTHSQDEAQARALILAPALELLPGETLGLVISVSGSANVINLFGGSGFAATTDFGHTARLSMVLPEGVDFISPTPAHWVTSVPEPATLAMWLAGLTGLALGHRARRR